MKRSLLKKMAVERAPTKRSFISVAIVLQIFSLALQNMPTSRPANRILSWYIGLTGQLQGWSMFSMMSPYGSRISIVEKKPDGSEAEPVGSSVSWKPRELDLATGALDSENSARAYLSALRNRVLTQIPPQNLTLRLLHKRLSPKPDSDNSYFVSKEYSAKW